MDRKKIHAINVERLSRWKDQLVNHHSTPLLLLGIGHDDQCGELHVCVTEDLTNAELLLFLKRAVQLVELQISTSN